MWLTGLAAPWHVGPKFPDQGSNSRPLHWQAGSEALDHGSPAHESLRSSAFSSISYYPDTLAGTLYLHPPQCFHTKKKWVHNTLFPLHHRAVMRPPLRTDVKNLIALGNSHGGHTPINLGSLSCSLLFTGTKFFLPQESLYKRSPLPVTLGAGHFLCALIILKNPLVTFLI